ncbi:glycosyltransferase family 2 protein [Pseudanabaena sp. Chao 1811]|uniref:glycosyltransferase family 2 protein n=1 Tax=Pseudanabaena sp. Chao 1811 TaxID=2963092 RepID=UPI0022F3A06C|nr:glycosyltransferase family 2 protein [Pseudanabaena sp. Chao 1811]
MYLKDTLESITNQIYPYWELCVIKNISVDSEINHILGNYIAKYEQIKVFDNQTNNDSDNFNNAIEIANGEFISLIENGDLLTHDAIYQMVLELNKYPNADMIYSDEDKIDDQGYLKNPFFKPDWCPDSFLSRMYTGSLGIYRKQLILQIGGFREEFNEGKVYDLLLRFTEQTSAIYHVSKILYHERLRSKSNSISNLACRAIFEAIDRRDTACESVSIQNGYYIPRYQIKECDLVSIIIPTKNLGKVLDRCLNSIFSKTNYPNYQVILVDNGSTENHAIRAIKEWQVKEPFRIKVYKYDIPFNYSKINNYAVQFAEGKYLLFLNNDTEIINADWMNAMVEQSQRHTIGAVGSLLLYPDNTVQHAGVILGMGGLADHCHKHFKQDSINYFGQIQTINNYLAVTGACLMCRKEIFYEVNGFEEELSVAFNDIDFCLKIIEKGYRNIYLPHVKLYHHESKSRGHDDTPEKLKRFNAEIKYMQTKWKKYIDYDPCYSPHLSRNHLDYRINLNN